MADEWVELTAAPSEIEGDYKNARILVNLSNATSIWTVTDRSKIGEAKDVSEIWFFATNDPACRIRVIENQAEISKRRRENASRS